MSAHDAIAALSMFFAGLILLIPHRIGMSRVNYVIKRYNLPISRAGLLLYKYHNNIELSLLLGTLPMVVIICTIAKVKEGDNKNKQPIRICMTIFLILMLLSSIIMYIIYISGGDFGHLNAFYFSLIFLTLCDGFANAFAFGINAPSSSLLSAGIPLSGFLVTLLHYIYKFFSDKFHIDDFDYYVLRLQLLCNIIIILLCIIIWVVDLILNQISAGDAHPVADWRELFNFGDEDAKHSADWSPIGMLAISLGTVYAFYPSIAPYSIIDFQYASIIELWILIISAIIPLTFAILDTITKFHTSLATGIGPSGKGDVNYPNNLSYTANTGSSCNWPGDFPGKKFVITQNWTSDNNPNLRFWHGFWLCAIFYVLCIQIFMSMLHYPHCLLSSYFINNPLRIGFISVLFNTLRELLQALGFAGAGKQVISPTSSTSTTTGSGNVQCHNGMNPNQDAQGQAWGGTHNSGCPNDGQSSWKDLTSDTKWSTTADKKTVNGTIAATNKLITLFVMMFCVFTGDGYLQHYRRCCRDNWPTTGYTKYQSFFYWLRFGFKGGIKSITSSFTDLYYHNLRPQFISYA